MPIYYDFKGSSRLCFYDIFLIRFKVCFVLPASIYFYYLFNKNELEKD